MKTLFSLIIMVALFSQGAIGLADNYAGEKGRRIQWLTDLDQALAEAKLKDKPVFLDFFNPK